MNSSSPNDDTKKNTSSTKVTCKCSKVTITFASARPSKSVECCCCDCRSALEWCLKQQQSDDDDVEADVSVTKPVTHLYVDNDILQIATKRLNSEESNNNIFQLMKLRQSGGSLRVLSKCCQSIMMSLHPFYLRNRIALLPDAVGKIEYEECITNPVTPTLRMQTKFWNDEIIGEPLPPLPTMTVENKETHELEVVPIPTTASDQPSWLFTTGMVPYMAYPLPTKQGFTARTLMEVYISKEDPMLIVGIPEPKLEGYYQTGGGMLSLTLKNPFYKNEEDKKPSHGTVK